MQHTVQIFGPQFDKYIYTTDLDPSLYEGVTIEDSELAEKFFVKANLNQLANKLNYDAILFPAGLKDLPMTFSKPAFLVVQEIIQKDEKFSFFSSINNMRKKNILSKVSGIIATSNYIKESLVSFGVSKQKIKVIYNGIDTNVFYPKGEKYQDTEFAVPFEIRKPYIIYPSSISEKEKRHIELIKAFEIFKDKTASPHRLVFAGQDGQVAGAVHQAVLSSTYASDIILAGYIEQKQLAHFYRESDLCIVPSEIEGVGLPIIEAMACGVPTASAKSAALPEIAGDASSYFDAKDPQSIAKVIEELSSDKFHSNEARRNDYIKRGLEWVKRFDWKKTADKTFEYIFERLES